MKEGTRFVDYDTHMIEPFRGLHAVGDDADLDSRCTWQPQTNMVSRIACGSPADTVRQPLLSNRH